MRNSAIEVEGVIRGARFRVPAAKKIAVYLEMRIIEPRRTRGINLEERERTPSFSFLFTSSLIEPLGEIRSTPPPPAKQRDRPVKVIPRSKNSPRGIRADQICLPKGSIVNASVRKNSNL